MKWYGNNLNEDFSKSEHIHHSLCNCFNFIIFNEGTQFIIEETKTFKGWIHILESILNFKKTTPQLFHYEKYSKSFPKVLSLCRTTVCLFLHAKDEVWHRTVRYPCQKLS